MAKELIRHGRSRSVQNLDLHQMDCTGLGWPSVEVIEGHQRRPTRVI